MLPARARSFDSPIHFGRKSLTSAQPLRSSVPDRVNQVAIGEVTSTRDIPSTELVSSVFAA
jgi:hypothetical protein